MGQTLGRPDAGSNPTGRALSFFFSGYLGNQTESDFNKLYMHLYVFGRSGLNGIIRLSIRRSIIAETAKKQQLKQLFLSIYLEFRRLFRHSNGVRFRQTKYATHMETTFRTQQNYRKCNPRSFAQKEPLSSLNE